MMLGLLEEGKTKVLCLEIFRRTRSERTHQRALFTVKKHEFDKVKRKKPGLPPIDIKTWLARQKKHDLSNTTTSLHHPISSS